MAEPRVTPVAVIGMACRLPGGIGAPASVHAPYLRGADAATKLAERWPG
ncbi:beta-ketoacyl synthase N-terminal-like domain-containing protein [Mycobacterium tuberculosis]